MTSPAPADDSGPAAKAALRRRLMAARAARTDRAETADRLLGHLLAAPWATAGTTVAAYVPVGSEPGSPAWVAALVERNVRVLLPIVVGAELEWAAYDGSLVPGPLGLREPAGDRLPLTAADAIVVPALAVDGGGNRLGKGRGYYDRALPTARAEAPTVAVVYDDELLDVVPTTDRDVRVTAVLTPVGGIVEVRR